MTMQLPVFKQYQDLDMNFIYIYKHKMRRVNHWTQNGEWMRIMDYGSYSGATWNSRTRAFLAKRDFGSPVRVRLTFPGDGTQEVCSYTISPTNEFGESVESSFTIHVMQPPYFRTSSEYRLSCSLSDVGSSRKYSSNNPNR